MAALSDRRRRRTKPASRTNGDKRGADNDSRTLGRDFCQPSRQLTAGLSSHPVRLQLRPSVPAGCERHFMKNASDAARARGPSARERFSFRTTPSVFAQDIQQCCARPVSVLRNKKAHAGMPAENRSRQVKKNYIPAENTGPAHRQSEPLEFFY